MMIRLMIKWHIYVYHLAKKKHSYGKMMGVHSYVRPLKDTPRIRNYLYIQ